MSDVTQILNQIESGDSSAAEKLLPLIYDELRRLAAQKMAGESPDHTLQATALVHDAYVRLVDAEKAQKWDSRGHFFIAAAEAMRRILVENARHKRRSRHGGGQRHLSLDNLDIADEEVSDNLLALDESLRKLSMEHQVAADVVKLRYFAGLTSEQSAQILGISKRTADRHWAFAKAWLFQQLDA